MAITVAMRTEVSQLYVALFGRAPDSEGLGFWVNQRNQGQTLTQIANAMFATAPARPYYPTWLTNQEIIAQFYENVLGRTADSEGLAFWTGKLNAAGATPGSVITADGRRRRPLHRHRRGRPGKRRPVQQQGCRRPVLR